MAALTCATATELSNNAADSIGNLISNPFRKKDFRTNASPGNAKI
jgi:hypothetical protein